MQHLKLFVIAFVVFIVTDMIWLGFVAKSVYTQAYAPWLRMDNGQLQPVLWAAAIVYLLFALATVTIVFPLASGSLAWTFAYGALLGAVIYGVYDFTTVAIFKDFPVGMAFVDWAWGTFLCAFSATVTALFK